jgi:hypothetical protein
MMEKTGCDCWQEKKDENQERKEKKETQGG